MNFPISQDRERFCIQNHPLQGLGHDMDWNFVDMHGQINTGYTSKRVRQITFFRYSSFRNLFNYPTGHGSRNRIRNTEQNKKLCWFASCRSLKKRVGSGSVSQRYGTVSLFYTVTKIFIKTIVTTLNLVGNYKGGRNITIYGRTVNIYLRYRYGTQGIHLMVRYPM